MDTFNQTLKTSACIFKFIDYSCVQWPLGLLRLGHMNMSGYPVKYWSLCVTVFSYGIWLERKLHAQGMNSPLQSCVRWKHRWKHWWKRGSTCVKAERASVFKKSPTWARWIAWTEWKTRQDNKVQFSPKGGRRSACEDVCYREKNLPILEALNGST